MFRKGGLENENSKMTDTSTFEHNCIYTRKHIHTSKVHSRTHSHCYTHSHPTFSTGMSKDNFNTKAGECKGGIKMRYKRMEEVLKKRGRREKMYVFTVHQVLAGLWDWWRLVGI